MIDRRAVVRAVGGLSATLLQGGAALAQAPAAKPTPPPSAPPRSITTSAWVNFEFAINWERVNTLQDILTNLVDRKVGDITLLLSSAGGDLAAALSTYNFLRSLGVRLTTYNIGNVYSAAMLLYLAGERRVVEPSGQFLIHAPSTGGYMGSLTEAQLGDRAESLRLDTDRFKDLLLERTHIGEEAVQQMMEKTTFVDPNQALKQGIATEVAHLVRPATSPLITLSQSTFHGPVQAPPAPAATPR